MLDTMKFPNWPANESIGFAEHYLPKSKCDRFPREIIGSILILRDVSSGQTKVATQKSDLRF